MDNVLSNIMSFGSLVLLFMLVYSMYLYIKSIILNKNKLTIEDLELLENACLYAVKYAEQMYKNDNMIDRYKLAVDYVYDVVNKSGLKYPELIKIIKGLIESHVLNLPKTNT